MGPSSGSREVSRCGVCVRLFRIWCWSLTAPDDLPCQPPSALRRAARSTLKSASVVATQGSTPALLPPRGGCSQSSTPGSDIMRNSTAIQRVLPMAARRAHKSECGERRRGASRDGGLRRSVGAELVNHNASNLPAESRDPAHPQIARSAPWRASREISRRGTRSQRRHGPQIGLWRSGAPLACFEPRPAQRARALGASSRAVSPCFGCGQNRRTARGGAMLVLFWA